MASNGSLTPFAPRPKKRAKKKGPPMDVVPKDDAKDRNFTKDGKPRLSATADSKGTGEGAMGQRR